MPKLADSLFVLVGVAATPLSLNIAEGLSLLSLDPCVKVQHSIAFAIGTHTCQAASTLACPHIGSGPSQHSHLEMELLASVVSLRMQTLAP